MFLLQIDSDFRRNFDNPEVAGLLIEFDKETTTMIRKTAAATPIDMLANVGGTLGLFCGVSIMSAVEVIYWIWKAFVGWISRLMNKPRNKTRPMTRKH